MAKNSRKSGLGKGFDSLLPTDFDDNLLLDAADKIERIMLKQLVPNRYQPRTDFDDSAIEELARSIKQYGILQPLVVTVGADGKYMIIAGERRWRAAKHLGLDKVPAIVRTSKDLEQLEIALIENVQRVNLSPLEQAASIDQLHNKFGVSYDEMSKRLGKASTTITNIVRLLQLPPDAKKALHNKQITEGHARAILALKDYPDNQRGLLENIKKNGWSVRQSEQFVVSHKEGFKEVKAAEERMQTETSDTKNLGKRLQAPVSIRRTAHGGRLEISFKSDQELEMIIRKLLP